MRKNKRWVNVMDEDYLIEQRKNASADRLATASFVLGIISLFSALCCCPFVFSAIGIILALLSKGAEKTLRPKAKTGIIMSAIGFGTSIVLTVFTIALPIFMIKTNPEYKKQFVEQYEEALSENEELFRKAYGDEMYEEMINFVENF